MNATAEELVARFNNIRLSVRNGRRAPYKPMLLIWAIGRCLNGEDRLVLFDTVERELTRLIHRFGPHRERVNAHYPFWRLQNDDELWEIDRPDLVTLTSAKHAHVSSLRSHNICGGLTQAVYDILKANPELAWRIVRDLLSAHFPPSLHRDVLLEAGLYDDLVIAPVALPVREVRRLSRDRAFRGTVLKAYESRCAVCEFAIRVDDSPVALEAAHIRWHSANGPALIRNGLALCALHHKLFDEGLFTILPDLSVLVYRSATGTGFEEWLDRYDGSTLRVIPSRCDHRPDSMYLMWHGREVFRSPETFRQSSSDMGFKNR